MKTAIDSIIDTARDTNAVADIRTGLSTKQTLFCAAYVACHRNISEAARRAGFSRMSAHRWLKMPDVLAEIERLSRPGCVAPVEPTAQSHYGQPEDRLIAECEALLDGGGLKPSEKLKTIQVLNELLERRDRRASSYEEMGESLDEFMRSVLSGGADLFR